MYNELGQPFGEELDENDSQEDKGELYDDINSLYNQDIREEDQDDIRSQ